MYDYRFHCHPWGLISKPIPREEKTPQGPALTYQFEVNPHVSGDRKCAAIGTENGSWDATPCQCGRVTWPGGNRTAPPQAGNLSLGPLIYVQPNHSWLGLQDAHRKLLTTARQSRVNRGLLSGKIRPGAKDILICLGHGPWTAINLSCHQHNPGGSPPLQPCDCSILPAGRCKTLSRTMQCRPTPFCHIRGARTRSASSSGRRVSRSTSHSSEAIGRSRTLASGQPSTALSGYGSTRKADSSAPGHAC